MTLKIATTFHQSQTSPPGGHFQHLMLHHSQISPGGSLVAQYYLPRPLAIIRQVRCHHRGYPVEALSGVRVAPPHHYLAKPLAIFRQHLGPVSLHFQSYWNSRNSVSLRRTGNLRSTDHTGPQFPDMSVCDQMRARDLEQKIASAREGPRGGAVRPEDVTPPPLPREAFGHYQAVSLPSQGPRERYYHSGPLPSDLYKKKNFIQPDTKLRLHDVMDGRDGRW
jgi:hypothetical protein